jgi:uncharacterized radical SAM protein YgiQ
MTRKETEKIGLDQLDVILVSGDAYIDHPAFGTGILGRILWDAGYSVGIIAQPNWRKADDFKVLGTPRLFFGVTSGNVDSMVNNYTPNLKRRSSDVYSPGGELKRPDRTATVYANQVHSLFPKVPLILGGIEGSLRRFAHYDYWSDSIRRSILADAPVDLLVFGMGERPILEVAGRLENGEKIGEISDVHGTAVKMGVKAWKSSSHEEYLVIPCFDEVSADKRKYAEAFALHYSEQDPFTGITVAQPHPKTVILQNPPALPLGTEELDHIYELPYTRKAYPYYKESIPALEPVKFSITSHRGCFGSCAFCALTHHQGRIVQSRSIESLVREAKRLTEMLDFKGIIQDIGGPTANMFGMSCPNWKHGACRDKLCTAGCQSLNRDHSRLVEVLRRIRALPGVRHVFIGSGVRHDLVLGDASGYLEELCTNHVSGHLKIAPEHVARSVTECMRKPPVEVLEVFRDEFYATSKKIGKEQYILPYFISGHPGCTVKDMVHLAEYIRDHHMYTEQVQDFTPTPMTISTAMYYTGLDPFTLEPVHVPKGPEKMIQRALLQYRDPKNRDLVYEGLVMAGRKDLIGDCDKCLIPAGQRTPPRHKKYEKR